MRLQRLPFRHRGLGLGRTTSRPAAGGPDGSGHSTAAFRVLAATGPEIGRDDEHADLDILELLDRDIAACRADRVKREGQAPAGARMSAGRTR